MSASTTKLISDSSISIEGVTKSFSGKLKSKSSLIRENHLECDSQKIQVFQESLQKLVPPSESDELSEQINSSSDEEEITDAETDMKLILDALQKDEKNLKKNGNKSFSDDKLREIERRNSLLMEKILAHSRRPNQYSVNMINNSKTTSAAINRRKAQKKIDHDNLILLRKIQTVKPFGLSRPKER